MTARKQTHRTSSWAAIAVPMIMVLGSLSLLPVVSGTSTGPALMAPHHGFRGLDLTLVVHGHHLPSAQPSPYCVTDGRFNLGFMFICYTPQDLKAAYNFPEHLNGSGQTIVIIGAWGSPTVQSDLDTFDAQFHLPSTTVQIVCQGGPCPTVNLSDPNQVGSTQEIALDTQYSHAMAPGAHIVLYLTKHDDDLTLERGVQSAVTMFPHSIISQSFGDPELDMKQGTCFLGTDLPNRVCSPAYVDKVLDTGEAAYRQAAHEGTTVFAGSGDWGADNSPLGFTSANPIYPSSSPWVTAVGGTMGNPYLLGANASCGTHRVCSTGLVTFRNTPSCELNTTTPNANASCIPVGYGGEQVWNEPAFGSATGGAPSLYFGTPAYQSGLGLTARTTPDISIDAAVSGGVMIFWGAVPSLAGFYIQGGTSASTPEWAGIAALADQLAAEKHLGSIGFINPALYLIGHIPWLYHRAFHDIRVGNNTVVGSPGNIGFNATRGWDDATGWGTPNVEALVPILVALSWDQGD
ncbi:MAG: S53 family peptidase [Thermoplasmata archaeon]|nr:S53 family peptidase [Thermoplasmata archaeon]